MALSDIQERLREDPETVLVDFAGEEKPFLLSTLGVQRANQRVENVIPKLFDLMQRYGKAISKGEGEDGEDVSEVAQGLEGAIKDSDLRDLTVIIWAGFLTFDDDLTLEEVQALITPGRLMRYGREIASSATSFVRKMDNGDAEGAKEPEVKN